MIIGGTGMLGHKAYQVFDPLFETWTTIRSSKKKVATLPFFDLAKVIENVDVDDIESVREAMNRVAPDVVLNCVGIVKQLREVETPSRTIAINALFPHLLCDLCEESGIRLIHVSTDCVFSGKEGNYEENSQPDAYDLYGRTKLLGEVQGKHSLTLRTSMIGREIERSIGLVEWFLSQRGGKVQGYRRVSFSGFTTQALASIIRDVILEYPDLTGLYHVSSDPINKFDLLCLMKDVMGLDIEVEPYDEYFCDRSLDSGKFRSLTGFLPPPWKVMIERLALETQHYEAWRKTVQR